jgi:hypothetical protein
MNREGAQWGAEAALVPLSNNQIVLHPMNQDLNNQISSMRLKTMVRYPPSTLYRLIMAGVHGAAANHCDFHQRVGPTGGTEIQPPPFMFIFIVRLRISETEHAFHLRWGIFLQSDRERKWAPSVLAARGVSERARWGTRGAHGRPVSLARLVGPWV